MKILIKRTLLTFAIAMISLMSFGQGATTSAFNGKIYDAKGETLPGASVQFIHIPTGTKYGTVTNANGSYLIPNVKPGGPYKMIVTFVGYNEFQKDDIQVDLGDNAQINANVTSKDVKLQEVVISSNKVFNASRTGASTNVSSKELNTMPTISRSLNDFTRLSPQVTVSGSSISVAGINNRYNNFQIDGTVNNDVFGLSASGTNGGQAGTQPISIDAIDAISVVVAPFDVRQGGFTGGGINAITKSGTNQIRGTAYVLGNNESLVGKYSIVQGKNVKSSDYNDKTYGFSLGGPIIKDKLFLFVNGELSDKSTPSNFNIGEGSQITQAQAQSFVDELAKKGILNPGGFDPYKSNRKSGKLFARVDYNISDKHKLVVRYNYVKATDDNLSRSEKALTLNNSGYTFNSTTQGVVAELNSRFSPVYSNELRVGYTRVRDFRDLMGDPTPNIQINNYIAGDGLKFNAGSEQYSAANSLDQDITTITDNFNMFFGKHNITIGTHNEFYKFKNVYIANYTGTYVFSTFSDFQNLKVNNYYYSFADPSTTGGDKKWGPTFNSMQLGFYAQDEYRPTDRLKLTLGIRADIPIFTDKPSTNPYFDTLSVATANGVATSKLPQTRILWSPRFGFNWDVFGNKSTQVRGGVGIFTGRVPFVWISNQFSNTGVEYARVSLTSPTATSPAGFAFNADPTQQYAPSPLTASNKTSEIDVTSKNFKYPQVFRISLGLDQKLPEDVLFTFDGLYSKTINNILYKNIKYTENDAITITEGGSADRSYYKQAYPSSVKNFNDIILLDNTNKGYAYSLSGMLTKNFPFGLNARFAYTYGMSKSVNDGTSSQASSNWKYNYVNSKSNSPELSYSYFDMRHKIIGSVGYTKKWGTFTSSTVSLFYTGISGRPYSLNYNYTSGQAGVVGGNISINGDNQTGNDLMYIPTDTEIDAMKANGQFIAIGGTKPVTVDDMVAAYKTFLATDNYTKSHRGQYAERNGAKTPFESQFDFHFAQEFYFNIGSRKQTVQFTFDVLNVANLINKDWGKSYYITYNVPTVSFVGFVKNAGGNADYSKPAFQYNPAAFPTNQTYSYSDFYSRWRGQIGIRWIF